MNLIKVKLYTNMITRAARLINQEIEQYLHCVSDRQKWAVLEVIKAFEAGCQDWWDEIGLEQQEAIPGAIAQMKAGKLTPQDSVLKSIRNGKSTIKNYIKSGD
jgi:hypothetical protein